MFEIKNSTGETIIQFNEFDEWEFTIDKTGYIDLLTQEDLDAGKVFGGKPIKKYATQERSIEVIQDIAQTILNSQRGKKYPKFYILPDE